VNDIVHPLKKNLSVRRNRDGGGALYTDPRRARTQDGGGFFDLVLFIGELSCIRTLE